MADSTNTTDITDSSKKPEANRDPITGAPGAHPIGTGVGAAMGGAAGGIAAAAAAGTVVGGPVGTVVGAAIGAIAGGLAGKAVAERFDPTEVDTYWRSKHGTESYVQEGTTYDDYAPAYRLGAEARGSSTTGSFEDSESTLRDRYDQVRGESKLGWEHAKDAVRASWERVKY